MESIDKRREEFLSKYTQYGKDLEEGRPKKEQKEQLEIYEYMNKTGSYPGRLTNPDGTVKNNKDFVRDVEKRESRGGNPKKKIRGMVAIGMVAMIFAGGITTVVHKEKESQMPYLEDVLKNEQTLKSLNISRNNQVQLNEYQSDMEKDLSNEELIQMATKIAELEKDVMKTKLVGVFEDVGKQDIEFYERTDGNNDKISARLAIGDRRYLGSELPSDMEDYIDSIIMMDDLKDAVQERNFNRDKLMLKYKDELEKTSKFAAKRVLKDENDKLRTEEIKIASKDKEDEGR